MEKCKEILYGILAENMKKSPEEVVELCRLDKWYTSDEAVASGLIDSVIRKKKK